MGMSLTGRGDRHFGCNHFTWGCFLELAYRYGWQPIGTEAPAWEVLGADPPIHADYPDWSGTYFSNDGQFVTDRDASNIAAALERALDDIPDHDAMEDEEIYICGTSGYDIQTAQDASPIEWFSGQGKTRVRDFIEFCRAGGFLID